MKISNDNNIWSCSNSSYRYKLFRQIRYSISKSCNIFSFCLKQFHLLVQLYKFDLHFMNSFKINLLFDQMFMVNVLSWLAFHDDVYVLCIGALMKIGMLFVRWCCIICFLFTPLKTIAILHTMLFEWYKYSFPRNIFWEKNNNACFKLDASFPVPKHTYSSF